VGVPTTERAILRDELDELAQELLGLTLEFRRHLPDSI
jgi:hypothetical protein